LFSNVVATKDDRTADELNADLRKVHLWGRKWNFNFEPGKCYSLCVSLKKDLDKHPPLFMDALSIAELDVLSIYLTAYSLGAV